MQEKKRMLPIEDLEHDPYRFLDELKPEWQVREECERDFTIPYHRFEEQYD